MRLRRPNEIATPVRSSRQWATALSPNAAGTGWNYIACCWPFRDPNPLEWVVVKDLTGSPTQTSFSTERNYPVSGSIAAQFRAPNGRIFFPSVSLYTSYYDPTTESVAQLGPVVETPPVGEHTSTSFYSARFDTAGLLYMGTQESESRPACIVVTDPATLTQTILGYVGENALVYTTYAYDLVPDTGTATKYVYVAYGQSPWQLWALNITPGPQFGTATKLYEVTAAGRVTLESRTNGWVAVIQTNVGQPDDVLTRYWLLDGTMYPWNSSSPTTPPVNAPAGRVITPASNPLVNPPSVDTTRGVGQVLWRFGSADWTLVEYDVEHSEDTKIESLIALSDGTALGNAEQYQGFFRYTPATGQTAWYGNWESGVSEPVMVEAGGLVYICGYPSSSLFVYTPSLPWISGTNPRLLGTYRATSHSHFAYCLEHCESNNRLYSLGRRDRDGVGAGLGYYDISAASFTGTSADLTFANPVGLIVLPEIQRIVASLTPLDGSAGVLVVFNYGLTEVARWTPSASWTDPGKLYTCNDGRCVVGVSATNGVAYRYDVVSGSLQKSVSLGGTVSASTQPTRGGEILAGIGGASMKSIDPNTLQVTDSCSGYPGIGKLSVGPVVYFSNGATLYQQGKITESNPRRQRQRRYWWF